MLMTYDRLNVAELRGTTLADILVSIDANFRLLDDGRTIYEEPDFPVVELARSLRKWVDRADGTDFVFDSMSFEELGAVTVRHDASGWIVGSVFDPDSVTSPIEWAALERSVRSFVARVAVDLAEMGIDDTEVFRA